MRNLYAFVAGAFFGTGLMVSGMTDTRKVQGWLDVFGNWDPTLAFVMGGAILPMFIAWRVAERRRFALMGDPMPPRPEPKLGRNLVLGSVLFGMGWGLVGLCPGPAIASISYGGVEGLVFLGSMLAGMLAMPPLRAWLDRPAAAH